MVVDPRAEPAYGERVPFVIVAGEPSARLVDKVGVQGHGLRAYC